MAKYCSLAYAAALEALKGQMHAMRDQIEPLRAEDGDGIHDMRVASRRTRALLAECGGLFAKPVARTLRKQVRDVTSRLSKARELDVSLAILERHRKGSHGPTCYAINHVVRSLRVLRRMESSAIADTVTLASSAEFNDRFQTLLHSVGDRKQCLVKNAVRSTTRRYRDVVEAHTRWQAARTQELLHRLRIAFKKLRYTCEIYRKTYGPVMDEFIESLKDAQDWIGEWHDYSIVRNYVHQASAGAPPRAAEGLPELLAVMDQKINTLLDTFTSQAGLLFEPSRQETIVAFLSSLHHECCWGDRASGVNLGR